MLRRWDKEGDERLKAYNERIAEEMGCTWRDIVMENQDPLPGRRWMIYATKFRNLQHAFSQRANGERVIAQRRRRIDWATDFV